MEYFGSSQQKLIKEKEIIKIRTNNTMMMGNLHQVQIVPNTKLQTEKKQTRLQAYYLVLKDGKNVNFYNSLNVKDKD